MSRLIEGARLCLYLAVIAFVVLCSGLVWSAHKAVVAIQADAHAIATSAQTVSAKTTLDLEEAHRLILEAGLTAMEARKASAEERAYLGKWNAGLEKTLESANNALEGLTASQAAIAAQTVSTLQQAQSAIAGLQPVESNLNASAEDLDALLKAPDLLATMHNLNTTTSQFAQTSVDFQAKFHAVLFPPKCQGHWCWFLKAYPIIKDAAGMAEPAYWAQQLIQSIK